MLNRGRPGRVPRQPPWSSHGTLLGPEQGHPLQGAGIGHLCPAWRVAFSEAGVTDACCPSSADRAELVEKWKAEREARLARGEKEEEEEEEEVNIYAVTEEEVRAAAAAPWGAVGEGAQAGVGVKVRPAPDGG